MAELLQLAARYIDSGIADGPVNRVSLELSEVADGVAVVESFSHVVAFDTDDGLVLFDVSLDALAAQVVTQLRRWSDRPVHTVVYTHGHVDHVGGARAVLDDAARRGSPRPVFVAHENVPARFDRYELTNGYNSVINARQFGRTGPVGADGDRPLFPRSFVRPGVTYRDRMQLRVGDLEVVLHHGRGETDDHTWAWIPRQRAICAGDFLIWVFPNAGNPQKVQRYPLEWARALREMAALEPELLLPAHGLPIAGAARIARVLDEVASVLEHLVRDTLVLMNEGAPLDRILQSVRVPEELLERPYLQPTYDEPEFVVRNIWRLYGGWYDGNPARLKPPADAVVAREVASLAGGVEVLVERALELCDAGDLRLAAHLVEQAVLAEPGDVAAHRVRSRVYAARRSEELSLMAKGVFGWAARESDDVVAASATARGPGAAEGVNGS